MKATMERKQKTHQLTRTPKSSGEKASALKRVQQQLNRETELLRRQTNVLNRQIIQQEKHMASYYKHSCTSTKITDQITAQKKEDNRSDATINFPQSPLFHKDSYNHNMLQGLLSGIKRLLLVNKMSASDQLVNTILQKERCCESLNNTRMIQYISQLARRLEPVIEQYDELLQHSNSAGEDLGQIDKLHRYARLIRYTMIYIIELIQLAKENHYLTPSLLGTDHYLRLIRDMLIHAYPQAACQNSTFSLSDIAQAHLQWARQFVALKHLSSYTPSGLRSSTVLLKHKIVIPTANADPLEQHLWHFYRECISRYYYQKSPQYDQIVCFKSYIQSTLAKNIIGQLTEDQVNERKLDWCFILADIGEVVQQCQQLNQNKFQQTMTVHNYVKHANFNRISLQDIQGTVDEINTETVFIPPISIEQG